MSNCSVCGYELAVCVDRKHKGTYWLCGDCAGERLDNLEEKSAQAYQVIGYLLDKAGMFETKEGQRALDYFSDTPAYDKEFLPWPDIKKEI